MRTNQKCLTCFKELLDWQISFCSNQCHSSYNKGKRSYVCKQCKESYSGTHFGSGKEKFARKGGFCTCKCKADYVYAKISGRRAPTDLSMSPSAIRGRLYKPLAKKRAKEIGCRHCGHFYQYPSKGMNTTFTQFCSVKCKTRYFDKRNEEIWRLKTESYSVIEIGEAVGLGRNQVSKILRGLSVLFPA